MRFNSWFLCMTVAMSAYAQDLTVPLPPGETPLADIGLYRVAYQSYGKEVVEMPVSWTGHFETVSGVSYVPNERVLDRPAILLHSPWRVPAGKAWVDYRLSLPNVTPIKSKRLDAKTRIELSFGIAMRPDMITPGRSDGVTFSCCLLDGAREQELMRHHQDKAEWLDYAFDLSPHAGKVVTLRLQVEPGPKNSPSFDYSYFGNARISAGAAQQSRSELIQRLTSSRAYRATANVGLQALANRPGQGVTSSNLLPCKNSIVKAGAGYQFIYDAADCRVVYAYEPKTGTLDDFTVRVDDSRPFLPAAGGGVTVAVQEGGKTKPVQARGGQASRIELVDGKTLRVLWDYKSVGAIHELPLLQGQSLQVRWEFGIVGKALTISARCDQPLVSGLSLGQVSGAALRRVIAVPYLPADWHRGVINYLAAENAFVCRYLDWTVSHASRCPQGEATYDTKTDGTRNPMLESGYVAVSPHVGEVLPNIPFPPSPFLSLLGPRIMLDVWGHHKGTYQGDAENLRDLKDNGVDHLAIISHVWQRYGYDVKLPDHLPADPRYGGDEGMMEFGKAANECGYVWSLHENYIDLYPDAPSYDPSARVLWADGRPSPAWFNKGTGVQSFGLKCNRALGYAKQNSPEIHRRFKTTAGYLDVHTCVPPWHQLDHEANQPMAAMALAKVKHDSELFKFMRETHEGPLFGEGANHFYWAGLVDGVEAQVAGGEHHTPFPDFDLLKLHPQMVNHGMGYYGRWFERGYNHRFGHDTGTVEQVDKYRAQELAYGHAGFIGSAQTDNVQWVAKEHHLMHPVQRLYGAAKATEVSYEVDGQFVSSSVALALGEVWRQRVKYDSGLTLWVNWRREPWEVEGRVLPQWGFLALGPQTEVCTALRNGNAKPPAGSKPAGGWRFADYAECPDYLFVDARTSFHMPYLRPGKDIEPRLREFRHLGGNKISLTYEWVVNDTLDRDLHCFVHFTNEQSAGGDHIEFQQDHALPKPTSQWRKGEVIVDGPYEVTVPAKFDAYDILIGLYKGDRVSLKGLHAGGNRILIGQLRVEREADKVKTVSLRPWAELAKKHVDTRADFTVRLNPPGTLVDFGKVATDGSVKIEKRQRKLVIFPYPRDKEIRLSLDLKALTPDADLTRIQVRALAAGTQQDLGKVDYKLDGNRLSLTLGKKAAGRYVVAW